MQTTDIIGDLVTGSREFPCVSVIVPTHRRSQDRSIDRLKIEKALLQAASYLLPNYTPSVVSAIESSLQALLGQVDRLHVQQGVGLFVSPDYARLVHFFMPVKEKVIIGNTFEIRDLVQEAYYGQPYAVIQLSEKDLHVYHGHFNELAEVQDGLFPLVYEDAYEYSKPVRGRSATGQTFVKGVERDRSQMVAIRKEQFYRKADHLLHSYLPPDRLLVIAGAERDLAAFAKITQHSRQVAGWLPGHYCNTGDTLAELSWSAVRLFLQQRTHTAITAAINSKGFLTDIVECWDAIEAGRGKQLLVERDFAKAAFLVEKEGREKLSLHPPASRHTIVPDVINELMIRILKKGGEVILSAEDSLRSPSHLMLLTRY